MDVGDSWPTRNVRAPYAAAANLLSDELWLHLFMMVSSDCPFDSFTALSEISAVSRTAAHALAPWRFEHMRLLRVNLEVEEEEDLAHAEALQDAEDFWDLWSVDSDGHWHDRYDDRRWTYQVIPELAVEFTTTELVEFRIRRLAMSFPTVFPFFTGAQDRANGIPDVVMDDGPAQRPGRNPTFEAGVGSPMSGASTITADFDPTLPPR